MTAPPLDHATRATGIGASEIPALLGIDPYGKTKFDLYVRKTAPPGTGSSPDTPAQAWGRRLERVILDALLEAHSLTELPHPGTVRHPTVPWAVATPDGVAETYVHHYKVGLEVKNRGSWTPEAWGVDGSATGVPRNVWAQCQWGLSCLPDTDCWYVGVLLGGSDFRAYRVFRDEEFLALAHHEAAMLWEQHIVPRVPPPVDGGDAAEGWLSVTYPMVRDATVAEVDGPEATLVRDLLAARTMAKAFQTEADTLAQQVKLALGDRAGLTCSYGKVTWTDTRGRTQVDWEALARSLGASEAAIHQHTIQKPSFRTFRVMEAK